MATVGKTQILEADDRKYVVVEVAAWGGTVRLGSMNAEERLEFEAVTRAKEAGDADADPMLAMLVRSIRNDQGAREFCDADAPALKKKDPSILLDLFRKAAELNVLTVESAEQVKGE